MDFDWNTLILIVFAAVALSWIEYDVYKTKKEERRGKSKHQS